MTSRGDLSFEIALNPSGALSLRQKNQPIQDKTDCPRDRSPRVNTTGVPATSPREEPLRVAVFVAETSACMRADLKAFANKWTPNKTEIEQCFIAK